MIQEFDTDSVSAHMNATPEAVYALVSDITRTPEFSPEIVKSNWIKGSTGPVVGARFRAWNKVPKRPAWCNSPVVTIAEPGRTFAFERSEVGGGTVEWRYDIEPDGAGAKVTESYRVVKPLTRFGWFIISVVMNAQDRQGALRAGMAQTLERMRAVVEAPARAAS